MKGKFPKKVRQVHKILSDDLVWLAYTWRTYKTLYGHSDKRIDLLEHAGVSFFYIVEQAIYTAVALNICRLTDPATSGWGKKQQENLTFERLCLEIEAEGNAALHRKVKRILKVLDASVRSLRKLRHKNLAHLDLKRAIRKAARRLPARKKIDEVLALMAQCLNIVAVAYGHGERFYEHLIVDGDADQVLTLIKSALQFYHLQEQDVVPWDVDLLGDWRDA